MLKWEIKVKVTSKYFWDLDYIVKLEFQAEIDLKMRFNFGSTL